MCFQYNFVIYQLPYVCIKLYVDNLISTHSEAVQLRLIAK